MSEIKKTASKYKERFQFVLYFNDNIVCQRYFPIQNYNSQVLNSVELKELADKLTGMSNNGILGDLGIIPSYLKNSSVDLMWAYYNPFAEQTEETHRYTSDKKDYFKFEILVDEKPVLTTMFVNNFFKPSVRNIFNIRDIIPTIVSEIENSFTQKKYVKQYGKVTI